MSGKGGDLVVVAEGLVWTLGQRKGKGKEKDRKGGVVIVVVSVGG